MFIFRYSKLPLAKNGSCCWTSEEKRVLEENYLMTPKQLKKLLPLQSEEGNAKQHSKQGFPGVVKYRTTINNHNHNQY